MKFTYNVSTERFKLAVERWHAVMENQESETCVMNPEFAVQTIIVENPRAEIALHNGDLIVLNLVDFAKREVLQ